jgi:hypothetical protein
MQSDRLKRREFITLLGGGDRVKLFTSSLTFYSSFNQRGLTVLRA